MDPTVRIRPNLRLPNRTHNIIQYHSIHKFYIKYYQNYQPTIKLIRILLIKLKIFHK
jgi:hypothetical protein